MERTDHPCRLFVYLARDAPVGVVLRRGPSDWVRLSRWSLADDAFEHGQWMRARVYERRSDLSPDGSLFVAFVRGTPDEPGPNRDSWIAVSRPPWFTALALWFVGGTYHTGGLFLDARTLWTGYASSSPDVGRLPSWLRTASGTGAVKPDGTNDWTDRTVWHHRLRRDGWLAVDKAGMSWERAHPGEPRTLRMLVRSALAWGAYGGRYLIDYEVTEADGGTTPLGRATWADWDQRGRLIVASEGRLLEVTGPGETRVLADLNDQTPAPEPAPAEAFSWPSPERS